MVARAEVGASSAQNEEKILQMTSNLVSQVVSFMKSNTFLALVASALPQQISSDGTQSPATPQTPAPTPPKDKKLRDWCVQNGGTYLEIPGFDPVCVRKVPPGSGEKFRLEVCKNTGFFGIQCVTLRLICPAGDPAPACYVVIDIPFNEIKCTIVHPSQYPGKIQLRCTGVAEGPVDLCYEYTPTPTPGFTLKQCKVPEGQEPAVQPITITPIAPFLPWLTPPTTIPPEFIPPGLPIPAPAKPVTPATPQTPAKASSLEGVVSQVGELVNQLGGFVKGR